MITHEVYWWCGPGTTKYRDGTVPACPNGRLFVTLSFPMCWDGVHRFTQSGAHVSFGMKAKCDAAHPVRIPALTAFVEYKVDGKNHKYVLASGDPTTAHADFFNAWEPSRLAHLVDKCLNHGRVESCKDDKHR
jgi:hypothetical protein